VTRNGKRKKNNAANRYVSDEEIWETKQDEVKKFETVVLSPVPELAHANNPGLDYEASKAMTKPNSLLK
jgi:ribonuclease HI